MLVTSPRRDDLLVTLVGRVVQMHRGGRLRVGVDGVDGAGKSVLADELADRIKVAGRLVVRASIDGFHRPRAERYHLGRTSPEGFYRDSYDYQRLCECLLNPFAPGGSGRFRIAAFDHRSDGPVAAPELIAGPNTVLIFDGIFLHRTELRGHWDFSVFLHVDFDVSVARCAARDGTSADDAKRRYVEGQRLYFREARPWDHASVVVDNTDLAAPTIIVPAQVGHDPAAS
jgi:uridine kinase